MKTALLALLSVALLASGCRTRMPANASASESAPAPQTARAAELQILHDDIEALRIRVDALEKTREELYAKLDQQKATCDQYNAEHRAAIDQLQGALKDALRDADAREQKLRQELVDMLTKLQQPAPKPAAAVQAPARAAAPGGKAYEHVVQTGETLSTIAAAYKVKPGLIVEVNGLKNANSIRVGQKLLIPITQEAGASN